MNFLCFGISSNIATFILIHFSFFFSSSDTYFYADIPISSNTWTHIVVNYIGPTNGEGIRIYSDGVHSGIDNTTTAESCSPGNGRVVLGRVFTDDGTPDYYGGLTMDDLLFFNTTLTQQEILQIKNIASK